MKNLLFVLLIISGGIKGQTKGDNTIKLPYTAYDSVKFALFKNGYNLNSDTSYIITSEKPVSGTAIVMKLLIFRTKDATFIKGQIKPMVSLELSGTKTESEFSNLLFTGGKSSPIRKTWNEMDRIAKFISSQVNYLKQ